MTLRWPSTAGVAGVDEAGRGPWAGPVVAAAVILPTTPCIEGLDDSKRLSEAARDRLAILIRERSLAFGLGWAEPAEIDALNILEATLLAMRRALLALPDRPAAVQVDGNRLPKVSGLFPGDPPAAEAMIGGDGREAAIAAASILAKTWRDAYMVAADARFPGYGFGAHKGYGTAAHRHALDRQGVCPLHRLTFEPVRSAAARSF
jgi:ribonuclease HII